MSIAAYVRVSHKSQKDDSQRAEIQKWLHAGGVDPAQVQWFADVETGTTLKRPAFEELQRAIFRGEVRTVVVFRLDRISRSLRDGVNLLSEWSERSLRVVAVGQQIDFAGPVGRLIASILLSLAEIELDVRRQRQRAGIEVAKKRGVYTGRRAGTFKAAPARARELRERGLTLPEIAKSLGVTPRTAFNYLKRAA